MRLSASFKLCILLIFFVWAGAGCARLRRDDAGEHPISLVMSLKNVDSSQEPATKMNSEITQSGGVFRGIEHLYVIPFNTENLQVEPQDARLGAQNISLATSGINKTGLVPNNNSHFFGSAFVPSGTNRVLTYGKSPDEGEGASKVSKHLYGVLNGNNLLDPSKSEDISFHLEPILAGGELDEMTVVESKADELLDQLNAIMTLMRESQYASIVSIYDAVKRVNQIQACSYAVFNQIRSEMQSALWKIPFESEELLQEIRHIQDAIGSFSTTLATLGSNFPANYGIPEGSLGFWWNGKAFIRLINSVNIALVNPASYCYPPSLWYYANSGVKTSDSDEVRSGYTQNSASWDVILDLYRDGDMVSGITQAMAIVDQLQYGVALMKLSLDAPGSDAASLIDKCPLTGIIIDEQKDLDYRFLPGTGESRFIYDNNVSGLYIGNTMSSAQTLVLETCVNQDVHFALEFTNTTGVKKYCQQGDILPWCKFYLAGVLKAPADGSVFTKDHYTEVKVKVGGLQSAYNTVPDLRSPQLEIGVVTEMRWSQITPQSIVLDF
ncbi:MAG: hypothetical protein IKZ60_06770 [Bacteroidales bacterium]|nr:hypothetical protein [Bacteroidales bacterium]